MPRKLPTKHVSVLGGFDLDADRNAGDYLASRMHTDSLLKKPPVLSENVAPFYTDAKFEHETMMKMFKELLERRKVQTILSLQRLNKVTKQQIHLRNHLIKVNNVLRDFEEKKKIAKRMILQNINEQKEMNNEIFEKRERLKVLKEFRKKFKTTADEYLVYETLLNDVVKLAEYPSVAALIDYCEALMLSQEEVTEFTDKASKEILSFKKRFIEISKYIETKYKGLMNELSQLSRSYESATNECLRWEQKLKEARKCFIDHQLEQRTTMDAVFEMYHLLCKRREIQPLLSRNEMVKILDFIKDETSMMQEVIVECKRQKKGGS